MDGLREKAIDKNGCPLNNDLGYVLHRLFPNEEWISNSYLKDVNGEYMTICGNHKIRPDYRCERLKLIVEFEGAGGRNNNHYCSAEQIIKDKQRKETMQNAGYSVICIPSYIQLDREMRTFYFKGRAKDIAFLYETENEHGFLHPQITLPANFCELGTNRFETEFQILQPSVQLKITDTLKTRVEGKINAGYSEKEAIAQVLPSRLVYLLKLSEKGKNL